jgi:hypothetical protein
MMKEAELVAEQEEAAIARNLIRRAHRHEIVRRCARALLVALFVGAVSASVSEFTAHATPKDAASASVRPAARSIEPTVHARRTDWALADRISNISRHG